MNSYSYCIRTRYGKGWGRGIGPNPSHCYQCGATLPKPPDTGASGYGCKDEEPAPALSTPMRDATIKLRKDEVITRSKAICYPCCAENTQRDMRDTGRAVLYLCDDGAGTTRTWRVSDWPGTLRIKPDSVRKSESRCFGRRVARFDVWFTHDSAQWHGVNIGDNQLLRCKRLKGTK
jgi:hypothetical protein